MNERPKPQISLEQYAGIRAALNEGYPLSDVLAQEGVPEWRWPELDREHTTAVTSDVAVFQRYQEKLVEAEDWLRRRIDPLDDDLAAWAGFIAAFSSEGQPLLERHGLRPADLGRLQRSWQKRFDRDPKLAKRAAELAQNRPAAPPAIHVEPGALRPFPWSPAGADAKAAGALEPLAFLSATTPAARIARYKTLPFAGTVEPPRASPVLEPVAAFGSTAPMQPPARREPATPFEPAPAPVAPAVPPPPEAQPRFAQPFPFAGSPTEPARLEPLQSVAQAIPHSPVDWTPEDYGRFCFELEAAGSERDEVLRRWGVGDEATLVLVQRRWRQRFTDDEKLRERFLAALLGDG